MRSGREIDFSLGRGRCMSILMPITAAHPHSTPSTHTVCKFPHFVALCALTFLV